jgi:hypothetical protein
MLKNNLTESYLKGYAVKLTSLLWTDETDYSEQKEKANQFVFNQLIQKGYKPQELMPELLLRSSGTVLTANETTSVVQDTISRLRIVIDNITFTGQDKTLELKGSNDNVTYYTSATVTISEDDTSKTVLFYDTYKYYKLVSTVSTGSLDFRAYLQETVYDELFACKWLVFIFADMRKAEGDQFDLRMQHYEDMYNQLINSATLYIDNNSDGIPDSQRQTNTVNILR